VGDHLYGGGFSKWHIFPPQCTFLMAYTYLSAFENYIISDDPKAFRKINKKENLPWTAYLGVLGMPGASICIS
jgi:hypothetical protein